MLRYLTAGESHGPALVAVLEGLPAGVPLTRDQIARELARRRLGYGRGEGSGVGGGRPGGAPRTTAKIAGELARRRLGYGRGKRMRFEQDRLEVLGGLRHGRTLGSPLAIRIDNSEWPKWTEVMSPDPIEGPEAVATGKGV